ncbi:hypothetical protein SBA3_750007 [Candidatus Sulfopaludibacter sp. SbA3]|nr:hypothetical protein SBA3_750007 [Candidatus Sulfopaludibacter sp. SbA3]
MAAPGTHAVVYRTALGKAMLAHLPKDQVEAALRSLTFQAFTPKTVTSAASFRSQLERVAQQVTPSTMKKACSAYAATPPRS